MSEPSERQRILLERPRWAWLGDVVDRWYAAPLTAADGSPREEVDAAAARLGATLPEALAEWFELVGRRLQPVQDYPATPADLAVVDGAPVVWTENQGVWQILCPPGAGDDPVCRVVDGELNLADAPFSRVVRGMVLSDTLVGAWAGVGEGPLGQLHDQIVGGLIEDPTDTEIERVATAYEETSIPANPSWSTSVRGDGATVIRDEFADGMGIEWMCAGEAALARFSSVVDLEPLDGEQQVDLTVEAASPDEVAPLLRPGGVVDLDRFVTAVGDAGGVTSAGVRGSRLVVEVRTTDPSAVSARLLSALPRSLHDRAVVTTRSTRIARPRVIHPLEG